jgi:hypothetical protein
MTEMNKTHLEDVAAFLREHRSSESNFDKLYAKLEEESAKGTADADYQQALSEIKEKSIPTYQKAKEAGGTAWPEFEKFVSEFERTVTEALRDKA